MTAMDQLWTPMEAAPVLKPRTTALLTVKTTSPIIMARKSLLRIPIARPTQLASSQWLSGSRSPMASTSA